MCLLAALPCSRLYCLNRQCIIAAKESRTRIDSCFVLLEKAVAGETIASAHRPLRRIRNKPSIIDHIASSNEPFYGSVIQKACLPCGQIR